MDTAAPVPAEKPEKENKPNNNKYQARQQRYNNNNNRNNNNNQAGRQQQQHQNTNHPAPQNTTANLPAPQPVVAEQVVQQPKPVEKPYEFDDILSEPECWKSCLMDMASSVLQTIIIFLLLMTFMYLSRKSNYSD